MALVGKERVLARIDRALAYIEARMAADPAAHCRHRSGVISPAIDAVMALVGGSGPSPVSTVP